MRQPNASAPGSADQGGHALTEFEELVVLNDDQLVGVTLAEEAIAVGHTPEGLMGEIVYVDFQKNVAYPLSLAKDGLRASHVLEVDFHLSGLGRYPSRDARQAAKTGLQQALLSMQLADQLKECLRTRRGDRALSVACEVIGDAIPAAATSTQPRQILLQAFEAFCTELQRQTEATFSRTSTPEPESLLNDELSLASPR